MSFVESSTDNEEADAAKVESYRCNACSIDFNLVDDLIGHTQQEHSNPDKSVTCSWCQVDFADLSEFIEHHRAVHLPNFNVDTNPIIEESLKDDETINLETSQTGNNEVPTQITILNDDGEAIGLAVSGEEETSTVTDSTSTAVPVSTFDSTTNSRKRRLPTRYRQQSAELIAAKRITPPSNINSKKNDVEIDISGLSSIRLKTRHTDRQDEIINYLEKVEEKLDCIIRHFNVSFNTQDSPLSPISGSPRLSIRKSVMQKTLLADRRSTQHEVTYIDCDTPAHEITHYVISDDLLEATYMKSRNRGNFAKNLVYAAFPLEERLGRNCYGRRGGSLSGPKDPLEQAKLDAVREAVFKKFPILDGEDEDPVWKRECVIAIDTALRSEMRSRILSMQQMMNKTENELKQPALVSMPM